MTGSPLVADELQIGVQVSSAAPGVTPVAFVAVVEAVDVDGVLRTTTIDSSGLTPQRRTRILAALDREPEQ